MQKDVIMLNYFITNLSIFYLFPNAKGCNYIKLFYYKCIEFLLFSNVKRRIRRRNMEIM